MPRYRLTIEYDGTGFLGWQYQTQGHTVQGVLEAAIIKLHGSYFNIQCAGRTDTGVHALAQVAHVDLPRSWDTFELINAINGNVRPHLVSVVAAEEVTTEFHARFSATGRDYLFRILNRRAPPAIDKNKVWHIPVKLNHEAMHEAAQYLVGTHDFTTFRAAECQANSATKTLERFEVSRYGDEIEIVAEARSFLHHQVRSMAGSLRLVGEGKWKPIDMKHALEARNRTACGAVAPPSGLYLAAVRY
jgi:tRNA pseudouridine38-40 synthase